MFRSFVLFIAAITTFEAVSLSQIFKVLRYFFHRYLLLSRVNHSFVIICLFTCCIVFLIFKFVTFKTSHSL